jgi:hypothetical protein|tara:strand:- start:1748 stop:2065 length:318 start_codon:yes stop_codon:yes gene_type:complete
MKYRDMMLGCVFMVALVSLLTLGVVGLRTVVGMLLVMVVPVYFILSSFVSDDLERIVFSLFLGVGLVPALIYWPATVVSLKLTVVVVALVLVAVGFWLKRRRSKS